MLTRVDVKITEKQTANHSHKFMQLTAVRLTEYCQTMSGICISLALWLQLEHTLQFTQALQLFLFPLANSC